MTRLCELELQQGLEDLAFLLFASALSPFFCHVPAVYLMRKGVIPGNPQRFGVCFRVQYRSRLTAFPILRAELDFFQLYLYLSEIPV